MYEETVLTQSNPKKSGSKLPAILSIAALACVVLATACRILPVMLTCLERLANGTEFWRYSMFWQVYVPMLVEAVQWGLIGLLLPACLLLTTTSTKKGIFGKVFFALAVLALLWQMGNAVSNGFYQAAYEELLKEMSTSWLMQIFVRVMSIVASFPGSQVLAALLNGLEALEAADSVRELLSDVVDILAYWTSDVLHIIATLLSVVGFLNIGFLGKKK